MNLLSDSENLLRNYELRSNKDVCLIDTTFWQSLVYRHTLEKAILVFTSSTYRKHPFIQIHRTH
jgi:hypothetical protein